MTKAANANIIIFTTKDTKLYVPVVTLLARENQKLSKLLSKGSERSAYWNEYKTKRENKNITNKYRYFLESNFVLVYTNEDVDQPIDSNVKRYKEIRKLTTGQGGDYINGYLLDYKYVKNHYRLIAVDLSREKELEADLKAIQHIEFVGQFKKLNNANNNPESVYFKNFRKKSKKRD